LRFGSASFGGCFGGAVRMGEERSQRISNIKILVLKMPRFKVKNRAEIGLKEGVQGIFAPEIRNIPMTKKVHQVYSINRIIGLIGLKD
jgi:hypothetical protein